jgi:hypothetical protein
MTRISLVPPETLHSKHLLAECMAPSTASTVELQPRERILLDLPDDSKSVITALLGG